MDGELAALAGSGATTLVGLMVSDSWTQLKSRLSALLARGGTDGANTLAADLDDSRAELLAARHEGDEAAAGDIEAAWRSRLRRALRADPALADELRALLAELAPVGRAGGGEVRNTITGGVVHGTVIQGRDFGSITLGSPDAGSSSAWTSRPGTPDAPGAPDVPERG